MGRQSMNTDTTPHGETSEPRLRAEKAHVAGCDGAGVVEVGADDKVAVARLFARQPLDALDQRAPVHLHKRIKESAGNAETQQRCVWGCIAAARSNAARQVGSSGTKALKKKKTNTETKATKKKKKKNPRA